MLRHKLDTDRSPQDECLMKEVAGGYKIQHIPVLAYSSHPIPAANYHSAKAGYLPMPPYSTRPFLLIR